jgi:hypothetical protein
LALQLAKIAQDLDRYVSYWRFYYEEQSALLLVTESWASLVDKSALEGLPDRERRRQEASLHFGSTLNGTTVLIRMDDKAIFELIVTEGAYVRDLQLVVEVREYLHDQFTDDLMHVRDVFWLYHVDILLEHVETLGAQGDCGYIFKY